MLQLSRRPPSRLGGDEIWSVDSQENQNLLREGEYRKGGEGGEGREGRGGEKGREGKGGRGGDPCVYL